MKKKILMFVLILGSLYVLTGINKPIEMTYYSQILKEDNEEIAPDEEILTTNNEDIYTTTSVEEEDIYTTSVGTEKSIDLTTNSDSYTLTIKKDTLKNVLYIAAGSLLVLISLTIVLTKTSKNKKKAKTKKFEFRNVRKESRT